MEKETFFSYVKQNPLFYLVCVNILLVDRCPTGHFATHLHRNTLSTVRMECSTFVLPVFYTLMFVYNVYIYIQRLTQSKLIESFEISA